jgi:hypothetical protein
MIINEILHITISVIQICITDIVMREKDHYYLSLDLIYSIK